MATGIWFAAPSAPALDGAAEAIDGDTLKVGGITVRLQAIDAPEQRQTCTDSDGSEWPCGREATRALARLASRPVRCSEAGEDTYGRVLGFCEAGGVSLNRRLVEDGWAYAFVKYDARYLDDEASARRARRGIWTGRSLPPWEWRAKRFAAAPEPSDSDCKIKGNVSRSGERIYHLPWQHGYEKTRISAANGERWFCTEDEALKAGWRRALR